MYLEKHPQEWRVVIPVMFFGKFDDGSTRNSSSLKGSSLNRWHFICFFHAMHILSCWLQSPAPWHPNYASERTTLNLRDRAKTNNYRLVVWNLFHIYLFHNHYYLYFIFIFIFMYLYSGNSHPTWFSYFSEGSGSTTNQRGISMISAIISHPLP